MLAIIPCDAITKRFNKGFREWQIRASFAGRCTKHYMKALQSYKPVFICVADAPKPQSKVTKKQIIATLASVQSGCCPGGKCDPGRCGPKKQRNSPFRGERQSMKGHPRAE